MTISSWKKEFYGPLSKATRSWLTATEHSLRKWEGARRVNLNKHSVALTEYGIVKAGEGRRAWYSGPVLYFDSDTCALCKRAETIPDVYDKCNACPLKKSMGVGCSNPRSPYMHYQDTGSPTKMIAALRTLHKQLLKADK